MLNAPQLRNYQLQTIQAVYSKLRTGTKKVLIVAPTGSGKTIMAAKIISDLVNAGQRMLFLVHLDVLVGQTYDKFKSFGLQCGFIKAGWEENRDAQIQIGSIQTLPRRSWWQEFKPDVIIWDEAHVTTWSRIACKIMTEFPNTIHLGLTATPWRLSKREGMGNKFDELVCAPMPGQLMEMGFLVKPCYYGIAGPDLKNVRSKAGDYLESDLALVCNTEEVVAHIVKEWFRLCQGRRTIAFAVNIAHSQHIADAFNAAGVPAEHIDGTMSSQQRAKIYGRLARGETLVVSSCNALSEGFDVPAVSALLLCRPTKSRSLAFQQLGRGLRIDPNSKKTDCLVLDQAENITRFGFVEDIKAIRLTYSKSDEPGEVPTKVCPSCSRIVHLSVMVCPDCGYKFPSKEKVSVTKKLERLLSAEDKAKFKFYRKKLLQGYQKKYAPGWAAVIFKEKYGYYPPDDWRRGAIFGEQPTSQNLADYRNYLEVVAKRKELPAEWIERQFVQEFGCQ